MGAVESLSMLDYQIVDVFTDRAFAGNPLAVVLGADDLSTEQMQSIAREFNLSETTFPTAASSPDAAYLLRIFTPSGELPFAGHPSVGSAFVMKQLGHVGDGRITQECGAGLLPLLIDGDRVTLGGGAPSIGPPVDAGKVLEALGLQDDDFAGDPLRWAGVGLQFGYLHVKREALDRCRPNMVKLSALTPTSQVSVFSYADGVARARVFVVGIGADEDPATGSAALGLGVWLAAAGCAAADGETSYVVEQGVEMGRPSRLECVVTCRDGDVVGTSVTGSVVRIAEGRIRVP